MICMWTERPVPVTDGLIIATSIGVALVAILSLWSAGDATRQPVSQCQEVVVIVERRGNVLARCPIGTYIDISDGANVVCRCGIDRQPTSVEVEPSDPPSSEETPNADPDPSYGDGGVWL